MTILKPSNAKPFDWKLKEFEIIRQKVKFKRDHGYKQQKRLKYKRAINKYTGKLKETKTTTNFITKIIYYSTKTLQINLILKVSSPQRESDMLKSSQSWMCPWSQFLVFQFVP